LDNEAVPATEKAYGYAEGSRNGRDRFVELLRVVGVNQERGT